jgi:hypothetical protein
LDLAEQLVTVAGLTADLVDERFCGALSVKSGRDVVSQPLGICDPLGMRSIPVWMTRHVRLPPC